MSHDDRQLPAQQKAVLLVSVDRLKVNKREINLDPEYKSQVCDPLASYLTFCVSHVPQWCKGGNDAYGLNCVPFKMHRLTSLTPSPSNVTVFENRIFKAITKVK